MKSKGELTITGLTMSSPKLDKSEFTNIGPNIYLMKGISEDTPLVRYIDFDVFTILLNNKQMYVNRRKSFSDMNEQGQPGNYMRFLEVVYPPEDIDAQNRNRKHSESKYKEDYENRKSIANWLTVCFTENTTENYFFWKVYTHHRFGVRISSTIKRFCDSIVQNNNYEIFIGRIKYGQVCNELCLNSNINSYAFAKTTPYQDEREIRVYFYPKEEPITNNPSNGIWIEINPDTLIESVILSPFMLTSFRNEITKQCERSNLKVLKSKIIETKI